MFPLKSYCGGFQINAQGIKGLGMGGAFVAAASDASTVFYNAARMSFLEKSSISVGGVFSKSNTSFLSPYDGNVKTKNSWDPLFHFYGSFKINEHLSAGLGYYSLYNYSTKWDDNWEGRFITRESNFSLNVIEPALSYKFNDFIGIGVGYFYGFGNYDSHKAIAETGTTGEATMQWNGKGKSGGFTASMFAKFSDEASAGLTFRSPMNYKIKDGTATFSGIPSSVSDQYPSVSSFTGEYKLPASVSGAVAYHFTNELTTTVQIDFNFWSRMDSLHIIFSDSSFSSHSGSQLNNTLDARVAVQYAFTDQFSLRGGFAYEQSPYPAEHVTPEFPDANKTLFSLGAGYKFNDKLGADIVVAVENYFERKAQDIATNFKGSYKTVKYMIGIGLNYDF